MNSSNYAFFVISQDYREKKKKKKSHSVTHFKIKPAKTCASYYSPFTNYMMQMVKLAQIIRLQSQL